MRVLVIRFRQMGDAVLATSLLNTIRHNFPDAIIDYVLNDRIAPLFENHPSIDHLITFTDAERHAPFVYIRKIWGIMHRHHYDVIMDLRSTVNTTLFALLSPFTKYRIGLDKSYVSLIYNYKISLSKPDESVVFHDLKFIGPLERIKPIERISRFTLGITDKEKSDFRTYMQQCGVNLTKPIILAGITSKLHNKTWNEDNMVFVLGHIIKKYPDVQIIFNYVPEIEEPAARRIYSKLTDAVPTDKVFVDVQANSPRQLAAMSGLITLYFGNEGGSRHIAEAVGKPSFVICSPNVRKANWLPESDIPSYGVDVMDILSAEQLSAMEYQEQYDAVTKEYVWDQLQKFIDGNHLL